MPGAESDHHSVLAGGFQGSSSTNLDRRVSEGKVKVVCCLGPKSRFKKAEQSPLPRLIEDILDVEIVNLQLDLVPVVGPSLSVETDHQLAGVEGLGVGGEHLQAGLALTGRDAVQQAGLLGLKVVEADPGGQGGMASLAGSVGQAARAGGEVEMLRSYQEDKDSALLRPERHSARSTVELEV